MFVESPVFSPIVIYFIPDSRTWQVCFASKKINNDSRKITRKTNLTLWTSRWTTTLSYLFTHWDGCSVGESTASACRSRIYSYRLTHKGLFLALFISLIRFSLSFSFLSQLSNCSSGRPGLLYIHHTCQQLYADFHRCVGGLPAQWYALNPHTSKRKEKKRSGNRPHGTFISCGQLLQVSNSGECFRLTAQQPTLTTGTNPYRLCFGSLSPYSTLYVSTATMIS